MTDPHNVHSLLKLLSAAATAVQDAQAGEVELSQEINGDGTVFTVIVRQESAAPRPLNIITNYPGAGEYAEK